jgi:hypothetical protein
VPYTIKAKAFALQGALRWARALKSASAQVAMVPYR